MGWASGVVKTMAMAITPAKLVSKGVERVKREVKEEVNDFADKVKIMIVLGVVILIGLLFLSITLALVINHFANNDILGFGILAGVYLVVFVLLFFNYKSRLT